MAEVQNIEDEQPALDQTLMDIDNEVPIDYGSKIEILKGYESDMSAATFCLHHEDHTIGNALRYMLMRNADVEFCGYSAPHPSEPKIHLRVQMYNHKSCLVALRQALDNLEGLFQTIGDSYETDLETEAFEKAEADGPSEEQLREMVRRGEEIKEQKKRQSSLGKNKKKEEAMS